MPPLSGCWRSIEIKRRKVEKETNDRYRPVTLRATVRLSPMLSLTDKNMRGAKHDAFEGFRLLVRFEVKALFYYGRMTILCNR